VSPPSGFAAMMTLQAAGLGDLQAIGKEGYEHVGCDAPLVLMEDFARFEGDEAIG
jgi:hypothetical protein